MAGAATKSERRGRGAVANPAGRFAPRAREAFRDGWEIEEDPPPLRTTVALDAARSVITRNQSPDVPFDRSVNPYRGCEDVMLSRGNRKNSKVF